MAEGVIEPEPDERELLWAAALLHDIGMAIGYDGHPEHAHYLILESGLPGYSPREVDLIAQIVRHHRKGSPEDDRVARCALLLQLAEQLDRGQDQSVIEARLVKQRRSLHLRLRGDDRLAVWSLERRISDGAFRRTFGRLVVTP